MNTISFIRTAVCAVALAGSVVSYAQEAERLYITGAFIGWNAENPQEFDRDGSVYTTEVTFSSSNTFKISTKAGNWTVFDEGAMEAFNLRPGVWAPLTPGKSNIESPVDGAARITVDLDNMTIRVDGSGAPSVDVSGTLPVMYINTEGAQPVTSKETYLNGTYYLDPCGTDAEAIGTPEEPLALQIRGRGNYTWSGFDKKPYRLKLDKKAALCGMKKSKHFALLAHADDSRGFLRNATGFELSRRIGLEWTPADEPVEVVLNGDYIGLYFLTETIRVDEDRVNVIEQDDLATTDVDGGWLVEIDNYDSDPHVSINSGDGWTVNFTYKSPEVLSAEQESWLRTQVETIDRLVFDPDKSVARWADYVDMVSLARFYIVNEIVDNYESFHGSCYMYRQRGEGNKWHFGPVWDFGSALNYDKSDYIYEGREHHMTWIGEMCKYDDFARVYKEEWLKLLDTGGEQLDSFIDSFISRISKASECDLRRWPQYGNADIASRASAVKERLRGSVAWLKARWGTSGIDTTTAASGMVRVSCRPGILVVESTDSRTVSVADITGCVRTLELAPGINEFELPAGFYIVEGGHKVIL